MSFYSNEIDPLLGKLLEETLSWEQFEEFLKTPTSPPNPVTQLIPEVGLLITNQIWKETVWTLSTSQNCYPTPVKAAATALVTQAVSTDKYSYRSPVKTFKTRSRTNSNANNSNSRPSKTKRTQLFSASKEDDNATEGVAFLPQEEQVGRFNSALEDRLNRDKKGTAASNSSSNARRSLDSNTNGGRRKSDGGNKKGYQKSQSTSKISLMDYIVPAKPKKKGKGGRRGSNDPVQEEAPTEEQPQPKEEAVSPIQERTITPLPLPCLPPDLAKPLTPEKARELYDKPDVWKQIAVSMEDNKASLMPDDDKVPELRTDLIQPRMSEVTNKAALDKLVMLYCYSIKRNLVPNVAVELGVMISLLTVQESKTTTVSANRSQSLYLNSVHNCVYFAVRFFLEQGSVLTHFDRDTLQQMANNPRVAEFSPDLKGKLDRALAAKGKVTENEGNKSEDRHMLESVRYHSETDNSKNFPSERVFQDYKKQRDGFYEIFRNWNTWRAEYTKEPAQPPPLPGYKHPPKRSPFQDKFSYSIAKLFEISTHPVNMLRFAQLFKTQLLTSCLSEDINGTDDQNPEDDAAKAADTGIKNFKMKLLRSRIDPGRPISPDQAQAHSDSRTSGLNRIQEFFYGFIEASTHVGFQTYLRNELMNVLVKKDAQEFADEGEDDLWTKSLKSEFSSCLLELRITAKFLGQIECLAYKPPSVYWADKPDLLDAQLANRKKVLPVMKLKDFVINSLNNGRLTLTLPWVTEYCLALDDISLQSTYYQTLFESLSHIYKTILVLSKPYIPEGRRLAPVNAFMLTVVLGRCFDNPAFPNELFFQTEDKSKLWLTEMLKKAKNPVRWNMDACAELLTGKLVYRCCPGLSELKPALEQFRSGLKNDDFCDSVRLLQENKQARIDRNIEPITPMRRKVPLISSASKATPAADDASSVFSQTGEDEEQPDPETLMALMEESFYHNQPDSLKRAADFFSERIASNLIKAVAKDAILDEAEAAAVLIRTLVSEMFSGRKEPPGDAEKEQATRKMRSMAIESSRNVVMKARKFFATEAPRACETSLTMLLPYGTKESVMQNVSKICARKIIKAGEDWLSTHVSVSYFLAEFKSEMLSAWNKSSRGEYIVLESPGIKALQQKALSVVKEKFKSHMPEMGPYHIMSAMRESILLLVKHKGAQKPHVSFSELIAYSDTCISAPKKTEPISLTAVKGLMAGTVALCLHYLTYMPSELSADTMDSLIRLWRRSNGCVVDQITLLICSGNVYLFSLSNTKKMTWNKLEHLLDRLLKSGLLTPLTLETQCVELLRSEWPQDTLSHMANCFNGVIGSWRKKEGHEKDFDQMMDWCMWFWEEEAAKFESDFPSL